MTLRDRSDIDAVEPLSRWIALAVFVAYWWLMLAAVRRLLWSVVELSKWFGDWRRECARGA